MTRKVETPTPAANSTVLMICEAEVGGYFCFFSANGRGAPNWASLVDELGRSANAVRQSGHDLSIDESKSLGRGARVSGDRKATVALLKLWLKDAGVEQARQSGELIVNGLEQFQKPKKRAPKLRAGRRSK